MEQQELLAKALQTFPKEPDESLKQEWLKNYKLSKMWPDGYELCKALCDLPDDVLYDPDVSGRFLYSNISTLRKGKFYLLAFNPKDDLDLNNNLSLGSEIRKWSADECSNAYLCESWAKRPIGEHKIQKSVKNLCTVIGNGIDITRQICASNLIFCRSKDVKNAIEKWERYLDNFWRVHKAILKIVKPVCIFAIGAGNDGDKDSTYRKIKDLLIKDKEFEGFDGLECFFPSGHGSLNFYAVEGYYLNNRLKVIGMPHFSRYVLNCEKLEKDNGILKKWINKQCYSERK